MKKTFIITILIVFASLLCGCEKELKEEMAVEQILFVPHQDGEDVRFIYGVYSNNTWSYAGENSYEFQCGILCYQKTWPDGMVEIYAGNDLVSVVPAGPDEFTENPVNIKVRFVEELSLRAVYVTDDGRVFKSKVYPFEIK